MIKHKVTILLILAIQSCFSQNLLETINAYNSSILDNTKEYKILIISDSSCGYCQITYKELQKFTSKIQIIILDYHEDNSSEIEKFNNYKFIPAREISEIKEQDFFPILFKPSLRPTDVVVFPSPAGVGVIAVTRISFPSGLFCKVSKYSKLTLAICLPIGLNAELSSGTLALAKMSLIGCIFASLAI